jgi:hypothetical protein
LDNSFALSLENFAIARKKWTEEEGVNENTDLFLLFSEGQVNYFKNRFTNLPTERILLFRNSSNVNY